MEPLLCSNLEKADAERCGFECREQSTLDISHFNLLWGQCN